MGHLLEREPFLQTLRSGFESTISGEGHCFFIIGEAGIGKTSLVKTFLHEVKSKSLTAVALCDSLFTPRPLGPFYDLALQISSDLAEKIEAASSRTESFAVFAQVLAQTVKPRIIVIEDIHWADGATLDFIKFLSRRISNLPCLFLLTFRDDEITPQHPLRSIMGELSPATFSRVNLTPLSCESVMKVAAENGYNGEDVYLISGGNPFYVHEIVASYSTGIPENIKDSILSVYNRQNEETKTAWQFLSVMPEGLEISRLAKIDKSWLDAIDESISKRILIINGERLSFKHELYRRTIESSLSTFKRMELNKAVLTLFLEDFEATGEIQRIVHYARNSAENRLVFQYALLAAKQAGSVGAHLEAAKLYLVAIDYCAANDPDGLIALYEAYTYECYLTNQIKEAITYLEKALVLWQAKGDKFHEGDSFRFLSRLWWFQGQREEAERYGLSAIQIFEALPVSKQKAMAFSNMSQLKMLSEDVAEAVKWGNRAIEIAASIGDEEILSHALNNVGTAKWKIPSLNKEGRKSLEESLHLALKNSFHEHAARAYTNLISNCINIKDYTSAEQYLQKGLKYCEERDLHSWIRYKQAWQTRMLLEKGRWAEANALAKRLTGSPVQTSIVKIGALVVQAIIAIRKGEAEGPALLREAKSLALVTKEHQRIMPVVIACLEYEWITGQSLLSDGELAMAISLVESTDNCYLNMEAAFWFVKARPQNTSYRKLYEKSAKLIQENDAVAAAYSEWMKCPYEQALLLFEGDEEAKRKSLLLLQELEATAVYEKLKGQMRSSGIRNIPRGVRASTRKNPAQLTLRELDILQLLKTGAQNKEIAAKLFISPKTVDHHISSILFKLDVSSRFKAVGEAEKMGI